MPPLLIKMKDNASCVLTAAELCAVSEMFLLLLLLKNLLLFTELVIMLMIYVDDLIQSVSGNSEFTRFEAKLKEG